jgi:outer membrane scaffolding protein for murein synthesis (MipA/OmpV family)
MGAALAGWMASRAKAQESATSVRGAQKVRRGVCRGSAIQVSLYWQELRASIGSGMAKVKLQGDA